MKLRIQEAIVVEGRYDKNTLSQLVDTLILETAGFGIFKNQEQLALLRRAAQTRGLIVLTDSDGAGFVIRNRIKSAIPPRYLKQPGREGKLGVEGMPPAVLEEVLRKAQATILDENAPKPFSGPPITKADLCTAGFSGGTDSVQKRKDLLKRLELPEHLSANGLLAVLNHCYGPEEGRKLLG